MGWPKGKKFSYEHRQNMRFSWSKERCEKYRQMALKRSSPKGFIKTIKGDNMELAGIGNAQCRPESPMGYETPSVTARLKAQKENLERQLSKVNEALTLLEASPDLQKAIDAISRVNY